MRTSKVFSLFAMLGALAIVQVSVDAAWGAKKEHAEKHEKKAKKAKKEKKEEKADKKEDKKDDKEKRDKREINNCPNGLSRGCGPGSCNCPPFAEYQKQVGEVAKQEKAKFDKDQKESKELLEKLRKASKDAAKASKKKAGICEGTCSGEVRFVAAP